MPASKAMRENLAELRATRIGWARFLRETQRDWRAMAHFLHRRWPLPEGVEPADVEQELLLGAWQHLESWRPDGGQPIHRWVTLGAMHAACGWLHKQRNSKGRRGKAPSRLHVRLDLFAEADSRSDVADYVAALAFDGRQVEIVEARERIEARLAECAGAREHYAFIAVVAGFGDRELAADALMADPRARRVLRIEDRTQARRAVRLAVPGR